MPITEQFDIGQFYTNDDIAQLGGEQRLFLALTKEGKVVAGRFKEDRNPQLPTRLFVGDSDKRLRAAAIFRDQTEFIPVFVKPSKAIRDPRKWRYAGEWRVANRTPDPIQDAKEVQEANARWKFVPKISLVLHLEREPESGVGDEALLRAEQAAEAEGAFDPSNVIEAKKRILASIVERRGQPEFRRKLLKAYRVHCAISDCDCEDALEAAHIQPYRGDESNDVQNGLLLRSDLHTLFDLGRISVDSGSWSILVSDKLKKTIYGKFQGARLQIPLDPKLRPSKEALDMHRKETGL